VHLNFPEVTEFFLFDLLHANFTPPIMGRMINRQLRAARVLAGYTQTELARRVGRSPAWLCRIERGLDKPTDIDVALLCRALKAGPDSLFPDVEQLQNAEAGVH
jgi:transcriptional regulator with XRE-family HTH domain